MSAARRITTLATHLRATTPVLSTSSPRLPAAFAAGRTSPKLGNLLSSAPAFDAANMGAAKDLVDAAIKDNKVVVFSKSYCPYCRKAKSILSEVTADFKVFELDEMDDGADIQVYLAQLNGQRTVPNIYIGQQHIGGCSDLQQLSKSEIQARIAA